MCNDCRWLDVAFELEEHLETRVPDLTGVALQKLREHIEAEAHITLAQREALTTIREAEGWAEA